MATHYMGIHSKYHSRMAGIKNSERVTAVLKRYRSEAWRKNTTGIWLLLRKLLAYEICGRNGHYTRSCAGSSYSALFIVHLLRQTIDLNFLLSFSGSTFLKHSLHYSESASSVSGTVSSRFQYHGAATTSHSNAAFTFFTRLVCLKHHVS